jgi:hypothetical protein
LSIDLAQIQDDVTFTRRGMSFADTTGKDISQRLKWILTRARGGDAGIQLQSAVGSWSSKKVWQYLLQVNRFLETLLCCVHITSRQLGRESEITTIRHRNRLLQDQDIFVVDSAVITVVRYYKSQSQRDKPKIVPRFLPPRLGQVMAVYLTYLAPVLGVSKRAGARRRLKRLCVE